MSSQHTGNVEPSIDLEEHRSLGGVNVKAVALYTFDAFTGTLNPAGASFIPFTYDYKAQTQNSTQDIWTYKSGGASGTLVATKTITYTDSTKSTISTIVRT